MMDPRHRELARHALGLPNDRRQSFRNRFVASEVHADHADWMLMVARGMAERRSAEEMLGGDDLFWLTQRGARAVLEVGETLDPEDFPEGA